MDQQQEWKRPLQQDDDPQGSEASPLVSSKTFRAPDAPASSPVITAPPGDPGSHSGCGMHDRTSRYMPMPSLAVARPDADDPRGVDQDPPAPSAPPGDSSYSAVPVVVDGSIARVRPRDGRIDTSHSRTFAWGLICNATPIILGVSALVVYLMEPQSKNGARHFLRPSCCLCPVRYTHVLLWFSQSPTESSYALRVICICGRGPTLSSTHHVFRTLLVSAHVGFLHRG